MSARGNFPTCCPVGLNALLPQRVPLWADNASSLQNFPNLTHPLPPPFIHLPAVVTICTCSLVWGNLPVLGKNALLFFLVLLFS